MNIFKNIIFSIVLAFTLSSCASLHAFGIVLTLKYDGKAVIEKEKDVIQFLENVMRNSDNYAMTAFNRRAISYKVRKTESTTHSFYVIYDITDNTYNTLSFSATSKQAVSEGAWAINTKSDIDSYINYLEGNNIWEVEEIIIDNGIDTLFTIRNVLSKVLHGITYYYNSKVNNNDYHDNCNSALWETIVGYD